MIKTVHDLNREQLDELKIIYATQLIENEGEEVFYSDLIEATSIISDDDIIRHYEGMIFSDDDFFCAE